MSRRAPDRERSSTSPPSPEEIEEENLEAPAVRAERQSLQQRLTEWLDLPLAILALIWVGLVVVELSLTLPPEVSERILQVEFVIWLIFAVDFTVEFALAPDKQRYLRTNFLAGLSVVLPFIRVVRVFRLAGVFRSVSLVRLIVVGNRATGAIAEVFNQHRFQYVLSLVVVITALGAAGVYFFERDVPGTRLSNFGEAIWWAATMVTTINVSTEPVTLEGRVIGLLLRVFALAVFGYITASIASFLVEQRVARRERPSEEREALVQLTHEVRRLHAELRELRTNREANKGDGPESKPP